MTTVELKRILMHQIAGINDKSFLEAIRTIIETKSETTIFKTTPEQQKRIKEGRAQIEKGEYFTRVRFEKPVTVRMDGRKGMAVISLNN
jgi:hypothetical protein